MPMKPVAPVIKILPCDSDAKLATCVYRRMAKDTVSDISEPNIFPSAGPKLTSSDMLSIRARPSSVSGDMLMACRPRDGLPERILRRPLSAGCRVTNA